ncbi:hypothetical protein SUNI508_10284 [Seiridium unicorne]|uniref:LCCL domain-containing protein n=1 Tax=Seiridium unicorne TaxID=138068 RepID=A0ABR2ULW2_9PEZI
MSLSDSFAMPHASDSDNDDVDSLPSTTTDSFSSEDDDYDAQREWERSLEQLQLLLTMILVPFAGKYFGRKFAYWSWSRGVTHRDRSEAGLEYQASQDSDVLVTLTRPQGLTTRIQQSATSAQTFTEAIAKHLWALKMQLESTSSIAMEDSASEKLQTRSSTETSAESQRGTKGVEDKRPTKVDAATWGFTPEDDYIHRSYRIKPVMSSSQIAPLVWFERRFPQKRQRIILFIGLCLTWSLTFAVLSNKSISPIKIQGAYQPVLQLTCTDSFWLPDHHCGIDGEICLTTAGSVAFHCPADCASVKLQKPYNIGPRSVVGQSLVIGGPIYRADSWICASAVHAGIMEDSTGGCGVISHMGQTNSYPSSKMNGIASAAVKTYFPRSFKFQIDSGFDCQRNDQTGLLPYLSIAFTVAVFLFSPKPTIPFFTTIGVGFFHANLFLDVDNEGGGLDSIPSNFVQKLISIIVKYLPILLCAILIYKRSTKRMLHKLAAPMEKTIFWLGAFWTGLIFDCFLREAVFAIPGLIALIVLHQMHYLRQEGRLSKSFPLYALLLLGLFTSLLLPVIPAGLLVLASLLLPGSPIQTRPNLVYQGFLVGILLTNLVQHTVFPFIGWVPASTSSGSSGLTAFSTPAINEPKIHITDASSNITFTWRTPIPSEVDGVSMLVNDVEQSRYFFSSSDEALFEWVRTPQAVPDYMRFGWVKGDRVLKYGDAGIWKIDGTWAELGSDGVEM